MHKSHRRIKSFLIIISCYSVNVQAQYLPLSGGTLTGNLNLSGTTQLQLPYLGFNNGNYTQPASSGNVSIFANATAGTLDIIGYTNGWRFIPGNSSYYASPAVTVNQYGDLNTAGNIYITKNLGIGTTSPGGLLSLGLNTSDLKFLLQENGNFKFGMGVVSNQFEQYINNGSSGNHFSWGNLSTDGNSTFSELMRLSTTGNLGIGTVDNAN